MGLTASNPLVSKAEAAELAACSERSVERKPEEFPTAAALPARNGRFSPQYAVNSLPSEAKRRWAEENVDALPLSTRVALGVELPAGRNLSEEDMAEAVRRYTILEPLLDPARHYALLERFPRKGELIAYLSETHQVRPRTIYGWLEGWSNKGGFAGLVPRGRADKGIPRVLNTAGLEFLLAAAMPRKGQYGVLSVREISRAYEEERIWRAAHADSPMADVERSKYARYIDAEGRLKPAAQLPQVSYQTLRRAFNDIPEVARVMARQGEEAFHNSQEIISFRALSEIRPLDFVVMDHRVLDAFCLVRDGRAWKLARPWLTAAIDMRTRKWLAWVIVETPSSDSIAAVLKRVFLSWGLPEACYWDNGKDFTSTWLEGKQARSRKAGAVAELAGAWRGVLNTLGVRVHHAIVKRARSKIIEPNFVRIANFDRTLPEWCGHKPTARPEAFDALVKQHEEWIAGRRATTPFRTIEQIAELYNSEIEDLNERPLEGEGMRKHTITGYGWMCPNEAWELLIRHVEVRKPTADALRFCFAKRREITVKHGEIRTSIAGRDYHYRTVGNDRALMELNGKTVQLAYDPLDLGEAAIYFEDRFVCLAHCIELRRMNDSAFVEDERTRRTARREVKRFIEAVHQAVPVADPETRLSRRQAVTPARSFSGVELPVALPAPIAEAQAAAKAEAEFSFNAVEAAEPIARRDTVSDGTDAFNFFGD